MLKLFQRQKSATVGFRASGTVLLTETTKQERYEVPCLPSQKLVAVQNSRNTERGGHNGGGGEYRIILVKCRP